MIEPLRITPFSLAQRFVGIKEVSGKMSNPMILSMLQLDSPWPQDDDVPWCSAFLNYIMWLLRLPRSKSLRAQSWLSIGIPIQSLGDAEPGFDIVVFWRGESVHSEQGHVGLYAGHGDIFISVLGGNQSDAVSLVPYAKDRLLGIRRISP